MAMTVLDYVAASSVAIGLKAYGTSEGASKGWDTRGRSRNEHAEALKKAGFGYRGKDEGLHRYSTVTKNPRYEGDGFGKNLQHNIWVNPNTGHWAHESSFNRSTMANGRGHGKDAKSLSEYLSSEKHVNTKSLTRSGTIWNRL